MRFIGTLVLILIGVAFAAVSITVLCTVVAAYGAYRAGRGLARRRRASMAADTHARRELLARADLQHRWYLEGDPRGTYGRYPPAGHQVA